MNKLDIVETDKVYAALKLIELLFKEGLIKQHVYHNILEDYKNDIDISSFQCYDT